MGAGQSRGDLDLPDSDNDYSEEENDDENYDTSSENESDKFSTPPPPSSSSYDVDDIDSRLKALKLKYGSNLPSSKGKKPAIKLYRHIGGVSSDSKWTLEKDVDCGFFRFAKFEVDEDDEDEEEEEKKSGGYWELRVGSKVKARVSSDLQMKMFPEQRRVVFIANGSVWAMKFFEQNNCYDQFLTEYQKCLFENLYGVEANDANKVKVYGKDFLSWVNPEAADDTMWDAPDSLEVEEGSAGRGKAKGASLDHDLLEEFEEEVTNTTGIQSLALGALDNSFLVGSDSIQVVKNFRHGVHGKGVCVKFDRGGRNSSGGGSSYSTPKKALLMRGETNMMLMSPVAEGKPHASGIHQLDIETGKIVTEWKFGKDGADISMRDITSDSKSSQLDPGGSTFLGLDDNRLCQWDMRDRKGVVQDIFNADNSPVLHWNQGHQFSRGTNFQCFATTGDGSIVVGSLDGKVRLYSKTSMRMAKTAFPSLGSPITHVDVTYDGKWVLATTDTYLLLICTLFTDKDGRTKTGFGGRMGNRASAPRLLKLMPLHAHMAGSNSKFHGGQFSWVTEDGKQERHIVVTVGKFSIIWNFEQVKNSAHKCYQSQQGLKSCYCYNIVLKDESIVDSRFMHEKFADCNSPEAPLVVATPMKVTSFSISAKQ